MIDFEALSMEREVNTWWSVPVPRTPERPEIIHRRREALIQAATGWRNPHVPSPAKRRKAAKRRALIQEVEFLLDCQVSPGQIAHQLGLTLATLVQALRRAGRNDLANPLDRALA